MKLILIFLCICIVKTSSRRYQITFPGGATLPYAKLYGTIDRSLNDFTLCHWSRSNVNNELRAAIFSYATAGAPESILSFVQHNKLEIHFRRNVPHSDVKTNMPNNKWLHICETWSIVDNNWQVFVNGERIGFGNWTPNQQAVLPNGVVILGQEQDTVGGGFQVDQSLTGQISELHLWDYVLTPNKILEVSKCENLNEGNVIAWNSATWALYSGSRISPVELPCGHPQ